MKASSTAFALAALAAPAISSAAPTTSAAPTVWQIDGSHATAEFRVRHLMVSSVRGVLGPVSGTLWLDEQNVERSRVEVKIDARGLDSREPKRDEHLRSADFFDVANHPWVTFRSTGVKRAKDGHLAVAGELTIRGITKPVTLDVDALPAAINDPWGNTKRGATGRTRLNRKDWGLVWNVALETGGFVVGDQVDVAIEVELVKQKDAIAGK